MGVAIVIVLDTHAFVFWAGGEVDKIGRSARMRLKKAEKSEGEIVVSAISAWEIAVLVNKGRLTLSMDVEDWLHHASLLPGVRILPLDWHTAVLSTRLPEPFHQDPADRIIVATARALNVPLVTMDEKIQAYGHVKSVW